MPLFTFSFIKYQEPVGYLNKATIGGLYSGVKPPFFLSFSRLLAVSTVLFCLSSAYPVAAQNVQRNNEAVDLGLRSNLTVNPATRAVELQIPLGSYPGRAGLDVPVAISYSSKLWNMAYQGFNPGPPPGYSGLAPFTILQAKYGEHSVSGWTATNGFASIDPSPGYQLYDQFGQARGSGDCSSGCYVIDRVMAWMPDGSAHELRSSDQALISTQALPDNLYSVDGSRMRYQRSTNTLFLPDGSRYVMSNPGGYIDRNGNTINAADTLGRTIAKPLPYNPGVSPSAPVDQNLSLPGVGAGGTINYVLKWRCLGDVLTNPQPLAYVADSGCPPGTGSFSPHLFTSDINSRTCIQNAMQLFNPVVLSQILLPSGQSYTFTYTTYGEIDKVMLPTGGYEKYVYSYILPVSFTSYVYAQYNRGVVSRTVSATGSSADEVSWAYSGGGVYVNMVAPDGTRTERWAWADGNSMWGYSSDGARSGRAYDERVYSASNQMLRRKLTEWSMTGSNGTSTPAGLQYANRNARVTRETEFILDTGGGALARTTTYGYDLTYQFDVGIDQTSVSQYDYVLIDQNTAQTIPATSLSSIPNGALLRTEQTAYLTGNANYRNRNIVGLPTSTIVYKGAVSDNIVVARSSISYDEGGQFAQLNDYGSVINWTDPGANVVRGNATTHSRWLNFNGSTFNTFYYGTGSVLTTHAQYDQCGSVRKIWDASDTTLTNPSQIGYVDSFSDGTPRNSYAYPTNTASAVPDSGQYGSNSAFVSTSMYDFNTGRAVSTTDANLQTTSYDYTDPLNRIKQVTAPNGARVRYNYSDAPADLYVAVLTDEDTRSIETRKYFDKLGRPARSFLYDGVGSMPWSVTDTYYDQMGRAAQVSNPYRASTPSAGVPTTCSVCTTTAYDALGRILSVTTPDNAQVSTSYGANTSGILGTTVIVTDQFCKVTDSSCIKRQRRSLMDALGRLLRVDEPDKDTGSLGDVSSPVQPTNYTYDLLGNLKRVDQGQQHRYFLYDSLSRLIRASNPEQSANSALTLNDPFQDPSYANNQWSMSYAYDANGNLTTKVDARNITTIYSYDALGRNKTVSYSGEQLVQGQYPTPAVSRRYDGWGPDTNGNAANHNIPNSKGHLWLTETSGTTGTRATIDGYDIMGRPTQQEQQFNTTSGWSATYKTSYTYDLASHIVSQTYPSGHTVNYNYDIAGRLGDNALNQVQPSALSGNLGDGVTRIYSSALSYDEAGRMQEEKYGTLTPLYHKQHFNVRGQLYDIRLGTTPWQTDQWNWNRGAITNSHDSRMTHGDPNSGPDNNGNLRRSESWVPGDEQVNTYTYATQDYVYDPLNRLQSVSEKPGSQSGQSAPSFAQAFTYDRWGNRTINMGNANGGPTWGYQINALQTAADTNTNRMYAPNDPSHTLIDYDVAGNQTKDNLTGNGTRVYDGENRMVSANSGSAIYIYNADSQRVRRNLSGTETWQVYGLGGELLAEYAANAAAFVPHEEYGYRGGQLLITAANGDEGRLVRFVTHYYLRALNRNPTTAEATSQINVLGAAGQSQAQLNEGAKTLARSLFNSSAYSARNRSDHDFVYDLYLACLQRQPDQGGWDYWTGQVPYQGRTNIVEAFVQSSEFAIYSRVLYGIDLFDTKRTDLFLTGFYSAALNRGPSSTEQTTQRVAFDTASATGRTAVIVAVQTFGDSLFNSAEYVARNRSNHDYVYDLYWAYLQYSPDSGGWSYWEGQVASQGRTLVRTAFAATPTFQEIAGGLYREVLWLTPDHLGTPRIIAERTGALAGIKRHDYLPFGEELFAGQGGRTTTPGGYPAAPNSNDSVRQKFTQKERDVETGLDYFEARYYASVQGRFTSVDPFNIAFEVQEEAEHNPKKAGVKLQIYLSQPQQWNRYSYALNNPVLYVDPSGEAIQLSNDQDERERQMQALRDAVGPGAAGYLYAHQESDGNWYVGINDSNPTNGDKRGFGQVNDVARLFSNVIVDPQVAKLEMVHPGTVYDDDGDSTHIGAAMGSSPAATGYFKGQLTIKLLDWGGNKTWWGGNFDLGSLSGDLMSDNKGNKLTPSIMTAHELSHAWDKMCGTADKEGSNQRAVDFENKVRKLQNPNGPTRRFHNPPRSP